MSTKAWIIFVAIVVVLFGGLVLWSQKDHIDVSKVNDDAIIAANQNNGNIADHVFGNKNAKVILIEYGDYQCPGCGAAYPRLKTLSEKYKDHMAFVFRNFPLTQIHPNARAAAAAAEAAGLSGKYWQMHDKIYENQNEWSDANGNDRTTLFTRYATEVGVNDTTFSTTIKNDSARINQKINFDQALGRKAGVNGTPTLYLNGTKLTEEQTTDDKALEKVLLDEFKAQGIDVSSTDKNK